MTLSTPFSPHGMQAFDPGLAGSSLAWEELRVPSQPCKERTIEFMGHSDCFVAVGQATPNSTQALASPRLNSGMVVV